MNGDESNDGEWKEWRRLIIHELKRLNKTQEESQKTIVGLQNSVSRLNLLAAGFGAFGGIIATILLQMVFGAMF